MPKVIKESHKLRFNPVLSYREMRRISRESEESIKIFKKILPSMPSYLTGNPVFLSGINYEQDYAIPLLGYLQKREDAKNKEVITKYAQLVVDLWQYGCSDSVFNFATNSGVDSQNRVIQIDIGELDFEKNMVAENVRSKKWLSQPSYRFYISNTALNDFFVGEMDNYATLENLDKYWMSKVNQSRK